MQNQKERGMGNCLKKRLPSYVNVITIDIKILKLVYSGDLQIDISKCVSLLIIVFHSYRNPNLEHVWETYADISRLFLQSCSSRPSPTENHNDSCFKYELNPVFLSFALSATSNEYNIEYYSTVIADFKEINDVRYQTLAMIIL